MKVALITGSSEGIGAGIAKLLGTKGYATIITYKSKKDEADKVVKHITSNNGNAVAVQLDVTSEESVKACFEFVKKEYGKLDILVNNAGIDGLR